MNQDKVSSTVLILSLVGTSFVFKFPSRGSGRTLLAGMSLPAAYSHAVPVHYPYNPSPQLRRMRRTLV